MRTRSIHHRGSRAGETVRALGRAMLLVGPLAGVLVLALASAPGARGDRPIALGGPDALDPTATGSIARPSVSFPAGNPLVLPNGGPCLRFPDGSQRGAC